MPRWESFAPSYSVTRQFRRPRLILLTASICGILLAILVTFISVATTAYEVRQVYRSDPNGTADSLHWYQKRPFTYLDSVETTCQDTMLVAGGRYTTMNRGFVYTLDKASKNGETVAQIPYRNSTLEQCEVAEIRVDLKRAANTRQSGRAWTWGETVASAIVNCSIAHINGMTWASLRVELPIVSQRGQITDTFQTHKGTDHRDLWYGARLTSEWYQQVALAMSYSIPNSSIGQTWATGHITLERNALKSDYKSLEFFYVGYYHILEEGMQVSQKGRSKLTALDWKTGNTNLPNTTSTVDAFAKSFYSLVATEFGLATEANALLTAEGANFLATATDDVARRASQPCYDDPDLPYCRAGNISISIGENVKFNTTRPTTLYAQYLCSVPEAKSPFVIFYTVVLANLVFLRACWSLFSFVASSVAESRNPTANYCAGCMASRADGKSVASSHGSTTALVNQAGSYQLAPLHERRPSSTASEPLLDDTTEQQVEEVLGHDRAIRRQHLMPP